MKKYNNWLSFTFYTKTGKIWYCEYIGSIDNKFIKGKSIAGGYGYDKESTCLSKSINKFNNHWVRYSKKSKKYNSYGLYDDNTISYGIGVSAVIKCLKCFKNVTITNLYFGINENNIKIAFN